jgi:hypothetical protein
VLVAAGHDLYLPCLLELAVDTLLFYELFLLDHSDRQWLLFVTACLLFKCFPQRKRVESIL